VDLSVIAKILRIGTDIGEKEKEGETEKHASKPVTKMDILATGI
jgi:hypothetical protein